MKTLNNLISKFVKLMFYCAIFSSLSVYGQGAGSTSTEVEKESLFERNSLFLDSVTESLSEKTGFFVGLLWQGEVWADVSRGSDINTTLDSLFTLTFEQDLSVAMNNEGLGWLGISAFYYNRTNGGGLGRLSSSQGDFSNILAGDMARVFEIYYANDFESNVGDFSIRIGQLASDEDFMGMDYSDTFLNSSFGAIPNVAPAQLFSQYSVATLGFVIGYTVDNFDIKLGVYNGNVGGDISSNNGFDYSNTFESVAFWYQLGYDYELFGLGGRTIFGGNYHSSPDKANFDAIASSSFYSFYVGVQLDILCDNDGLTILGTFARIGVVPDSGASDNNFYADFGFNWFAPIPERDEDIFAIGVSIIENERESCREYAHYETTLEASYRMQVTPAIVFQPDMQIYFNPAARDETGTAYVVGARLEVIF